MSQSAPFIGIDFGTTNSKTAWFDANNNRAEILSNSEGEEKTPSLVYYGKHETLVGKLAADILRDSERLEDSKIRREEHKRFIKSIKRNLINPPRIALPDNRDVRPVDVVADILRKIKSDAKEYHFNEKVERCVITYPAEFDAKQRKKIEEGAHLAGFVEIKMLAEPVAAALAFAQSGYKVGNGVLVYDLGGGTFDLAFVARHADNSFYEMGTSGDALCGGDDFDQALYDYWDKEAKQQLERTISMSPGVVDMHFLNECRVRKEMLSKREQAEFRSLLPGGRSFVVKIKRATFEDLIRNRIKQTVNKTEEMLGQLQASGQKVDTLVLIGGSSEIPLVEQMLKERIKVTLQKWQRRDVAVALGAAYHGHKVWGVKTSSPTKTVKETKAPGKLSQTGAKSTGSSDQARYAAAKNQLEILYPPNYTPGGSSGNPKPKEKPKEKPTKDVTVAEATKRLEEIVNKQRMAAASSGPLKKATTAKIVDQIPQTQPKPPAKKEATPTPVVNTTPAPTFSSGGCIAICGVGFLVMGIMAVIGGSSAAGFMLIVGIIMLIAGSLMSK